MRTQTKFWILAIGVFLASLLIATNVSGQQMTPEQIQQMVVERAREIERREAEEKRADELAKQDTPAMRKARKELQKEYDRDKKRRKLLAETERFASVTGCDVGTVEVAPSATRHSRNSAQVTLRVINTKNFPVNIETGYKHIGVAVRNLCPGGAVTLGFVLGYPESTNYSSVNIVLTARGTNTTGGMFSSQYGVSLSYYHTFGVQSLNLQRDDRSWEIR